MDIGTASFVVLICSLIAYILEESLSLSVYALEMWKSAFIIALTLCSKWAWDLAMAQEWGYLIVLGFVILVMGFSLHRANMRKRFIENRFNASTTDWVEAWFRHLNKAIKQDRKLLEQILIELKTLNSKIDKNTKLER